MTNHSAPPDEQAFPLLDVSQIAKLRPFGRTRSISTRQEMAPNGEADISKFGTKLTLGMRDTV